MNLIEKTIGEYITENAARYGERMAVQLRDWSVSFSELDQITDLLILRLKDEWKIQKGTHVGLWSVNTPDFLFLFFAMVKYGAVPVPINTCFREKEISDILNSMDIEVLFYGKGWKELVYQEMIPEIRSLAPGVRSFVSMDSLSAGEHLSLSDFPGGRISEEQRQEIHRLRAAVSCRDVACIMMTSGTTLMPKGVMLTHFNIVNDGLAASACMHWSDQDKTLLALPFFHCFGLITGAVGAVIRGMQMYLLPHFSTVGVWHAIEERGCTVLNGVPSIFLALIRKPEYQKKRCDTLKSGIIGGSVLREEDYFDICSHFPAMHLQTSYGMTEASPSLTFPDWDAPLSEKARHCGRFMEGIEARSADIHTGKVLPPGKIGEIQIRGFNVTEGYYNMPEETRKAFTEDGFFKTGDLGYFDEKENLVITGRLKELIIRAGENISVAEIENAILDSGMAAGVKVVGVSSEFRQEEIAALVVPEDAGNFDGEALRNYLAGRLAVYKIPDAILKVDALPLTGSGKIDLNASRHLAESLLSAAGSKNEKQ